MKQRTLEDIEQIYYKVESREYWLDVKKPNSYSPFFHEVVKPLFDQEVSKLIAKSVLQFQNTIEININGRFYTFYHRNCVEIDKYTWFSTSRPVPTMFVRNNELIEY